MAWADQFPPRDGGGPAKVVEVDVAKLVSRLVRAVVGAIVGLLVVIGLLSSFYTVQPEERAVVKRFGAVNRIEEPGLRFKIPYGIERVQRLATERVLKQEFGFRTTEISSGGTNYVKQGYSDESLMLTGDLNVIDVEWVVQYKIDDPIKYLYIGAISPDGALRAVSEAVMRRIIGNQLGAVALTVGREQIGADARLEMQQILDQYNTGLRVERVVLQDVTVPDRVKPSFNEVNESRQELERLTNEAERRRNEVLPRALGEAQQLIAEAEGYAVERVNRARGEAARFLSLMEEYQRAPEIMRRRMYLETMDEVLPTVGALYLTSDGDSAPLPILNLDAPSGATTLPGVAPAAEARR
jgi:membrane protease subunit HflK